MVGWRPGDGSVATACCCGAILAEPWRPGLAFRQDAVAQPMTDRERGSAIIPAVRFTRFYFAFAAGYLLSYLYRTVNAVISPELTRDLSLNPSSLGLLTSAYFLAFAAMQVPVGMLLDRYGPRRVEPVLLVVAATGAVLFALRRIAGRARAGTRADRRRRERLPDGAAESDQRLVSGRPPGVLLGLDDGRRRRRRAGGDGAARARAARHRLARRVRRALRW